MCIEKNNIYLNVLTVFFYFKKVRSDGARLEDMDIQFDIEILTASGDLDIYIIKTVDIKNIAAFIQPINDLSIDISLTVSEIYANSKQGTSSNSTKAKQSTSSPSKTTSKSLATTTKGQYIQFPPQTDIMKNFIVCCSNMKLYDKVKLLL